MAYGGGVIAVGGVFLFCADFGAITVFAALNIATVADADDKIVADGKNGNKVIYNIVFAVVGGRCLPLAALGDKNNL